MQHRCNGDQYCSMRMFKRKCFGHERCRSPARSLRVYVSRMCLWHRLQYLPAELYVHTFTWRTFSRRYALQRGIFTQQTRYNEPFDAARSSQWMHTFIWHIMSIRGEYFFIYFLFLFSFYIYSFLLEAPQLNIANMLSCVHQRHTTLIPAEIMSMFSFVRLRPGSIVIYLVCWCVCAATATVRHNKQVYIHIICIIINWFRLIATTYM